MPIFQSVVVTRRRKERGQRRERDRKNMHTDKSHIMSIGPPVNRQQHTKTKRGEEVVVWCHKKSRRRRRRLGLRESQDLEKQMNMVGRRRRRRRVEPSTVWVCFLVLFLLFYFMVPIPSILFLLLPSFASLSGRPSVRPSDQPTNQPIVRPSFQDQVYWHRANGFLFLYCYPLLETGNIGNDSLSSRLIDPRALFFPRDDAAAEH